MRKFFKRIFRPFEKPTSEIVTGEPPELLRGWKYFQHGDYSKSISEAKQHVHSKDAHVNFEANKLMALSNFQLGQYDLAQQTFEVLARKSEDSDDWFNLVTSATLNRQVELGRKAFDRSIELYQQTGSAENLSHPNMIFYYMLCLRDIGQFELAFEQLQDLKTIYCELVITDSTFLHMRGVPFFEHTMDAAKDILKNIEESEAASWIDSWKDSIDSDGKLHLNQLKQEISWS